MKRIFNQALIALLASAAVAGATPILRLSSTTVTATVSQGTNAPSQTVQLYNIGDGSLSPQATSTASWVQAAVGSQTAACSASTNGCLPLALSFSTSSLAAGSYSALVVVTDPSAVDAPQTIEVSLTLASVPTALTFYATPNGGGQNATFYTQGPATTKVSTATGGGWLSVQLQTTTGDTYVPYQVTANSSTLSMAGTYTGSVVVSGSNSSADNHAIAVTLNVTTSPIGQLGIPAVNVALGANQQQTIPVTIANIGSTSSSFTVTGATPTTSNGTGWLTAVLASGGGSVTITLNTASLTPGIYQGSVAISSNAVNNSALTIPVSLVVTQQTGPQISVGGVVDGASYQAMLSPGDIAAAFGLGITSGNPTNAPSVPLPTILGGTQVLVNGTYAPIYYTSTGQLNFQVPYEAPVGLATVQVVNNGVPGNMVSATVAARAPRIPVLPGGAPVIVNYQDNSLPVVNPTSLPSHPAALGDTLIMYAFGLGQTDPPATTGAAATSSPLLQIDPPVFVMLGGGFNPEVQITPSFTGLVPGLVGLYQINFSIPKNAPTGNSIPLTLNVPGASSNLVDIAICDPTVTPSCT